ncbi:ATP-dependent DNA helicase RecG [Sulfobacillus thermosulfidooxidans DSM 9293]|uniref:ATP-dependent DNA helicase RecG n=2 Tax=Sulfobacillus thermosulfidooxidans TaxID=28034 RepID=A0A1W1WMG9_SULTA|nr:ATP-dependent DNA helicase RecG [Sulfobacillus thermosulfidooxidans]SMC07494.1 ATP-dependent DNA helicase RecG [Sulfobacillus thermosulfidooxidans DSM 9293]
MAKSRTTHSVLLGPGDMVTKWPGIGETRALELENLGVKTFEDLLGLWPHRHEDRSVITPLWMVQDGESVTVQGIIQSAHYDPVKKILRVQIQEGHASLTAIFFHASWLKRQFEPGYKAIFSGKAERRGHQLSMAHPDFQVMTEDREPLLGLVPIYPLSGSLKQVFMQRLMRDIVPRFAPQLSDPLPRPIQEQEGLISRPEAILHQHFPPNALALEASRKRLVFDEFLRIALAVLLMHQVDPHVPGMVQKPDGPLVQRFLASLPFSLTEGQKKAWDEIQHDLRQPTPMARLLQGDVGSGKTVIAILTMLAAVDAGHQAAFMAPTELLAEQQWLVLQNFLRPLGLSVALLTGKDRHADTYREALKTGSILLVVGTQALIGDRVEFKRLGVVVVDEQHRFGVKQRARLSLKGEYPDMLVMTATPIPRTLALTVYGDLQVSEVRGLPPGRKPVETIHLSHKDRRIAYQRVMAAVKRGEQAYVVCPLVGGDDEETQAKAAVDLAEGMKKIPGWRIGLLHGKMHSKDKTRIMEQFRQGDIDVLVATTIVEVGVDVPNATMMVIEEADRFGLAQLHQLRGRVGRGPKPATCFLIADPKTDQARERLEAMVRFHEGLKLAEEDLRLRGPGEILGMRQHGLTGFQLAHPLKDLDLLQRARGVAREIVRSDPQLVQPEHQALRTWVLDAMDDGIPSQVLH